MIYTLLLLISLSQAPFPADAASPAPSPAVEVEPTQTLITWECPEVELLSYLPRGLTGYMAPGCGWSGEDGSVLLPARDMMVAAPPGADVRLEVIPEGVGQLGPASVSRTDVSPQGIDVFTAARMEQVPSSWGLILESGSFRRAGFVRIRLHPVIMRDGVLVSADRLRVRMTYPSDGRPAPSAGRSGDVFSALFQGGDRVWETPARRLQDSPFWGLPWYALELDTAGIYSVEWSDVPQAAGASSSSLALFCGRGREMGDQPWENLYSPREVPILVDDGGDGTFDQGDRFYFFGRGLAWWEPSGLEMPDHFNHRYDHRNTYWLTWGGADGARMDILDGELTGAPAMPDSFLSRYHLEQNQVRVRGTVPFSDDWAWLRSSGSADSWHYFDFSAPGALGTGYARLSLASTEIKKHRIRIFLNSDLMCDTSWNSTTPFMLQFPLEGIQDGENNLSFQVLRDSGSDVIYMDWFEIFPWTGSTAAGQVQVPLEWWPVFDRRSFTREAGLEDAMVFLVAGDTLASSVTLNDPNTFEFQVPNSWLSRELWISDAGAVFSPAGITYRSPGRIIGTMNGAECLYVAADQLAETAAPLGQRAGAEVLPATEVYQEFNGGVRDPGAVRAMVSWVIDSWDPIPTDLVLVGAGNWDPRNFITSRTSYIDILYRSTHVVSDDQFAIVQDLNVPQMAVSRIGVSNSSDLQLVVSRSADYREVDSPGSWQTVVLGAADDERSPLHNNDERYHTQGVERLLTERLPEVLRPEKLYLIFYDWNSVWSKPEARADYIEAWSRGALVSFFLGHGSYDQLADEGLLYLEDKDLLSCGSRLPVAFFGSCEVGLFQDPSTDCIAQQVTTSPAGGAILGLGATGMTGGPANETMVGAIFDRLFSHSDLSVGMCVMLGKIDAGYGSNNSMYALFGDGSLPLAFPWETFDIAADTLLTGEFNTVSGTAPSEGLLLVEAWESSLPDTYYTFRHSLPIGYLTSPGRFYSGSAPAGPGFSTDMFVPVDSDTGRLARTSLTFLNGEGMAFASTYPEWLLRGEPAEDTEGPEIELWIDGYRNTPAPEVSGQVVVRAELSDSSGINLLSNPGRQLALYLDGTPQDVSEYFEYKRGSSTTGGLTAGLGILEPGVHTLGLRAADGLLNISLEEMEFSVTRDNDFAIFDVFPYPNPCVDGTSINWTQTAPGTVEISIYTVAGRRVARFGNIQGDAGYNQCWWDCRDADGDEVSNGAYIFVISAASAAVSSGTSEVTGVIAVLRQP